MKNCYWHFMDGKCLLHCTDIDKARQIADWSKCELHSVYDERGYDVAIDVLVPEELFNKACEILGLEPEALRLLKSDIPVIDLKAKYGDKYKIAIDPAAEGMTVIDPMYLIIPGRYGEIFPCGYDFLAVMVTGPKIAKKMEPWPELEIIQDADDAVIFKFHVDNFEKVAKMIKANRKYRISEAERKRRSQRLKNRANKGKNINNNSQNLTVTRSK